MAVELRAVRDVERRDPTAWRRATTEPTAVALSRLTGGLSPRLGGESRPHVDSLAEAKGAWPPIVVDRATMRVVDGMHRLLAARQLGLETIQVVFFDGTEEEARHEAIRTNNQHGLPLTLAEKRQCARDILDEHPTWSDRRIAAICGLSPKTVGVLRPREAAPVVPAEADRIRVGRDGRAQRIRGAGEGSPRERVLAVLAEDRYASLRAVARKAGTSPETVRTVRRTLLGERPAPSTEDRGPVSHPSRDDPGPRRLWAQDSAIASTPEREEFGTWFDQTSLSGRDLSYADVVPLSRIYEAIDEARRRAEMWDVFSRRLQARIPS
jgi:ParB-like chromosome segregation protein Spo0J